MWQFQEGIPWLVWQAQYQCRGEFSSWCTASTTTEKEKQVCAHIVLYVFCFYFLMFFFFFLKLARELCTIVLVEGKSHTETHHTHSHICIDKKDLITRKQRKVRTWTTKTKGITDTSSICATELRPLMFQIKICYCPIQKYSNTWPDSNS